MGDGDRDSEDGGAYLATNPNSKVQAAHTSQEHSHDVIQVLLAVDQDKKIN